MKMQTRSKIIAVLGITLLSSLYSSPQAFAAKRAAKTTSASGGPQIHVIKMDGDTGKDIVEITVGSKDHKTLATAVKLAGLVETLGGAGPYTVFAPTDAAFGKLPKGTVENLTKPENTEKLRAVLEHHTAAPRYSPEVLATLTELDMVDGPKLKIENKSGKIYVDGVELHTAIVAKNGIIYVVDSVLLAK